MGLCLKDVSIDPLTGPFDLRSNPDQVQVGGVRWRQNLRTVSEGKLRRGGGWEKLLNQAGYNNQDFHDQLLEITDGVRQPVTLLFEAESIRNIRYLIVGTEGTLAILSESTGNYRILGTGYGHGETTANGPRFMAARLGDYVVFTNDLDAPMYHVLEQPLSAGTLLNTFDDLELIGVTRARFVWEWKNVILFANYEQDGGRVSNGIIWSDFRNPKGFDPAQPESITGEQLLRDNEVIVGGAPCGKSFLIYTNLGIWEMTVGTGEKAFTFRVAYEDRENRKGCLFYSNSLVSLGDAHLYMGSDSIYIFNQYQQKPDELDWIYRSTQKMFDTLDSSACNAHVSGICDNEVYVSWTETGTSNLCPTKTLRLNMKYKTVDLIDFGFTAFTNFRSSPVSTVRDFILDNAICTVAGLRELGYGFEDEGLPRSFVDPAPAFEPQSIHTQEELTVGGVTTEDYTGPSDEDSLCALLGEATLDSICRGCQPVKLFVAASSGDWCLKQLNTVFYRERCTNPTAVGTTDAEGYYASIGTYILDGYDSILRFPPAWTKQSEVLCERLQINYIPVYQDTPSKLHLRIGQSGQVADPNTDNCNLIWQAMTPKDLKCLGTQTAQQYSDNHERPAVPLYWTFWFQSQYLYFELKISGTGGDAVFSGINTDMRAVKQVRS